MLEKKYLCEWITVKVPKIINSLVVNWLYNLNMESKKSQHKNVKFLNLIVRSRSRYVKLYFHGGH